MAKDGYGSGSEKISMAGMSTALKRSRQRSTSSPASMEASDGARVAMARATGVKELNDRRGAVFIRRSLSW